MTSELAPAFGVDLITFFDPAYWGLEGADAVAKYAAGEPRRFWDRILDALVRAGIQQVEITFEPAGYRTAELAYGAAEDFGAALGCRGLALASGYFGEIEHATDLAAPDVRARILTEADRQADFLAAAGGRYLVVGLPMRRDAAAGGYEPVDLRAAEPVAELVNQVAARTAARGVRTLLHNESHSMFWNARDVDLMLLLTDAMLVGLCLDTGHATLAGSDPVAIAERHFERLGLLHWKDAAGRFPDSPRIDADIFTAHREHFRPIGAGIVDWVALAALLDRKGFRECVLLELDVAPDPEAELLAARTYLESNLGEALPPFAPKAR